MGVWTRLPRASCTAAGPCAEAGADADLPFNVFAKSCPSRRTLENVTGRWGSLTLGALYEGGSRFNELRRRVDGVSEKMLSQTLHSLERDGLVTARGAADQPAAGRLRADAAGP